MSEENKKLVCTSCGSENPAESKFCSSCGQKLEQPVYEKVEGETVSEGPLSQLKQDSELHIQYGPAEGEYSSAENSYQTEAQSSPYASSENIKTEGNGNIGFSIAAMICGILSILCCCFTFLGLILGIAAIVLGIISLNGGYDGRGMAIAGIITGGFGIAVFVLFMLISGFTGFLGTMLEELMYYMY